MTKITLSNAHGNVILSIDGHSGYSTSGTDIVCSAISILQYSFATWLEEKEKESGYIQIHTLNVKPGFASIAYSDPREESKSNLEMLIGGFEALAEMYPNNVEFEWGEI